MKNLNRKIALLVLLAISLTVALVFKPETVQSDMPIEQVIIQTANEKRAQDIAKTIAHIETNGNFDCSRVGLNGEKSCYQFLPSTWASYSKEVLGYVAPQTPENTKKVVEGKVTKWLDQGLTDRQIFLIWNQGHPGQCRKGVNKKGVAYDSCSYANKGIAVLNKVINTN